MKSHDYISIKFQKNDNCKAVSYVQLPVNIHNASQVAKQLYGKRIADGAAKIGITIDKLPEFSLFEHFCDRNNCDTKYPYTYSGLGYTIRAKYVK